METNNETETLGLVIRRAVGAWMEADANRDLLSEYRSVDLYVLEALGEAGYVLRRAGEW